METVYTDPFLTLFLVLKHYITRDCPEHILNVMNMSGITCEQDLEEHLDQALENEWGTHVELTILGALAKIDVLVINATHTDTNPHSAVFFMKVIS